MKFFLRLLRLAGFALAATVLLHGADRPPMAYAPMGVANGCFVETVALLDDWHDAMGADAWARLLEWGAKDDEDALAGHAVTVCEARGKLWCYDINFGWRALPLDLGQRDDLPAVAAPIVARYPKITAVYPVYRYDLAQAAATSPPVAQLTAESAAVRDASVVGARLATHRPVNVVRFDYGPDESKAEGAATVFLFGGRYCVYTPMRGTMIYLRVRGGIENLRLIQELLRRLYPGVGAVKKLGS